jgi:Undecaprenyl-phosphate glucose phosphotransferase
MSTATDLLPKPSRDTPAAAPSPAPDAVDELRTPADRRGPFRPKTLVSSRARLQGWTVARFLQAADVLALAAAGGLLLLFPQDDPIALITAAVGGVAVMGALSAFQAYDFQARESLGRQAVSVSAAFAMGAACACMALLLISPHTSPADALLVWAPVAWIGILALHTAGWFAVRRWRASGRLTPNIVVVGATGAAERLVAAMLRTREANILGVFDDRAARSPRAVHGVPVLGDTQALLDHRIMPYVDRVVISVPSRARDRVGQLIERLRVLPNEITLLLDGEGEAHEAAAIERIAHLPLARLSGPPSNHARALAKRMQDLVVGTLALILAAPIMLAVAVAIRLDSPGPALFRQRRHGFNNEEIVVFKFRSMKVESADARATRQISADDDRVTRVGRFIRRTSLDELPQIFNVLTGEMSLVGPRPHAIGMMTGDVESARLVAEYAHRHRMKPGMTGWAAIHGSRGPVATADSVKRRVALDVEYIDRQSFWLDLYIMAVTIPCLLGDTETVR